MSRAQVITISNGKAGSTTKEYQDELHRISREYAFIHHYPTGSVDDIEGVLDEVHSKYGGRPLHFVKVSGDGGYHHLLTALAKHSLLNEYPKSSSSFLPDAITVSPTGHGTQNVVAKRAGVRPDRVLVTLPRLSSARLDDTVDVELMRIKDDGREVYGFMFAAGPMVQEGSRVYHEGKFGALNLATILMRSSLSLVPIINYLPWLRSHYEALFSKKIEASFQFGNESKDISCGAFIASAETLSLGHLRLWNREAGKIHVHYGSVQKLSQGLMLLWQMLMKRPFSAGNVTSMHTGAFSLESLSWYSVDDEPYTGAGRVEVSMAGVVRIPKVLTQS